MQQQLIFQLMNNKTFTSKQNPSDFKRAFNVSDNVSKFIINNIVN